MEAVPDFEKLLQEIRDITGWSDYKIAAWINKDGNVLVHQPQIYNMRTGKMAPTYAPRYELGRKILDLHKLVKQYAEAEAEGN